MKTYFPNPKDLLTPEYAEHVKWEAAVWKANDERNKQDKNHLRIAEENRIAESMKRCCCNSI